MPLPELVEQMRLVLQQLNQKARVWQDRYVSPDTGEFIVRTVPHDHIIVGPESTIAASF